MSTPDLVEAVERMEELNDCLDAVDQYMRQMGLRLASRGPRWGRLGRGR